MNSKNLKRRLRSYSFTDEISTLDKPNPIPRSRRSRSQDDLQNYPKLPRRISEKSLTKNNKTAANAIEQHCLLKNRNFSHLQVNPRPPVQLEMQNLPVHLNPRPPVQLEMQNLPVHLNPRPPVQLEMQNLPVHSNPRPPVQLEMQNLPVHLNPATNSADSRETALPEIPVQVTSEKEDTDPEKKSEFMSALNLTRKISATEESRKGSKASAGTLVYNFNFPLNYYLQATSVEDWPSFPQHFSDDSREERKEQSSSPEDLPSFPQHFSNDSLEERKEQSSSPEDWPSFPQHFSNDSHEERKEQSSSWESTESDISIIPWKTKSKSSKFCSTDIREMMYGFVNMALNAVALQNLPVHLNPRPPVQLEMQNLPVQVNPRPPVQLEMQNLPVHLNPATNPADSRETALPEIPVQVTSEKEDTDPEKKSEFMSALNLTRKISATEESRKGSKASAGTLVYNFNFPLNYYLQATSVEDWPSFPQHFSDDSHEGRKEQSSSWESTESDISIIPWKTKRVKPVFCMNEENSSSQSDDEQSDSGGSPRDYTQRATEDGDRFECGTREGGPCRKRFTQQKCLKRRERKHKIEMERKGSSGSSSTSSTSSSSSYE
ncbi:hypothetical protein CEXT_515471 [Caerostris extrusa]|uniref:Uncharacterized protein n=1 Tax=Caerostris extrusa TaxID=172846 RepID=A0AAV4Q9B0_CAEEX|nr:hypothetical protein CEXT_515471 [Caerostris extrusa]